MYAILNLLYKNVRQRKFDQSVLAVALSYGRRKGI